MQDAGPSWGERARTALAAAEVGTLVTCPGPGQCRSTIVSVEGHRAGRPRVWLERSAPAAATLAHFPTASLVVPGPPPFRCLALRGRLRPFNTYLSGCRPFEMALAAAWLIGARTQAICVDDLTRAEPDPLYRDSASIVAHLESAHREDLLACVRAHGYRDARAVVPRALTRYGLELAAVSAAGVRCLRLDFPRGPVSGFHEIEVGLRAILACRCRKATS